MWATVSVTTVVLASDRKCTGHDDDDDDDDNWDVSTTTRRTSNVAGWRIFFSLRVAGNVF